MFYVEIHKSQVLQRLHRPCEENQLSNMAGINTINQIVSEKLDDNNFHAWKFRMNNFLMGKGYWEYMEGEHEEAPVILDENPTAAQVKAFKDWNQGARKVLHWLSINIKDTMIGHV